MMRSIRIFLILGVFLLGFILSAIGWSVPLTPYWLNTVFFSVGVPLETIAAIYILAKVIKRVAAGGRAE
jgi:hypothetical protein